MENLDTEIRGSCENTDFVVDNKSNLEFELNESSKIYNPQVSDKLRPKKAQEFETIKDVLTFCNSYAKAAGFSV